MRNLASPPALFHFVSYTTTNSPLSRGCLTFLPTSGPSSCRIKAKFLSTVLRLSPLLSVLAVLLYGVLLTIWTA